MQFSVCIISSITSNILKICSNLFYFSATDGQFKGVGDVFTHLMKTEGPKALYKGAAPVMVRAFVANSCCFMGYELAMWTLNKIA